MAWMAERLAEYKRHRRGATAAIRRLQGGLGVVLEELRADYQASYAINAGLAGGLLSAGNRSETSA